MGDLGRRSASQARPVQEVARGLTKVRVERRPMRLAIVHDYLIQMGGAERVVAAMAEAFPEAPIYTSVTDYDHLLPEFIGKDIRHNWLNRLPGSPRHFTTLFPLSPFAFPSMPRVYTDI